MHLIFTCNFSCLKDGLNGTQGPRGPKGYKGQMGIKGSIGKQGTSGLIGAPGLMGMIGLNGTSGHKASLNSHTACIHLFRNHRCQNTCAHVHTKDSFLVFNWNLMIYLCLYWYR